MAKVWIHDSFRLIRLCFFSQVMTLQEEKRALERLTKSKETALLEVEKILKSALERALVVEEIQNQNYELKRQIEICQVRHLIFSLPPFQKRVSALPDIY